MATLNNYADVQNLLNAFVAATVPPVTPGLAPHGIFWNTLSYEEFTTGNVPGVHYHGKALPILVIGNAAASNIIQALSGTAGSPFGPGGGIGQMPRPTPPYNSGNPSQTEVIAALSEWINNGCPNPTSEKKGEHSAHPKK
jgi:hypothetical protein